MGSDRTRPSQKNAKSRGKMFQPITIPYESVMLLNECRLKPNVKFDEVELAIAEVCSKTKDSQDGFIAGQVFSYAGFISPEGSIGEQGEELPHFLLITYWKDFSEHEDSHQYPPIKEAFGDLLEFLAETKELGYHLEWQGEKEK